MTPVNSADLKKLKCVFVNSSIAKTIPPNGVLNAAASPAAAPVTIIFCFEIFGYQAGNKSLIFLNMEAEIWIVGPSLPMTPPPNTAIKLEKIFTKIIFNFQKVFPKITGLDVQVIVGDLQKALKAKSNGTALELK